MKMTNCNELEIFESEREFKKKYKSKLYICSWCGLMTPNPDVCIHCHKQANQLFTENIYKYRIEGQEERHIFKPIERRIND